MPTINIERLQRVIDFIRAEPENFRFDMNQWFNSRDVETDGDGNPIFCGTAMCIGGTANWLEGQDAGAKLDRIMMMTEGDAARWLGMDLGWRESDLTQWDIEQGLTLEEVFGDASSTQFRSLPDQLFYGRAPSPEDMANAEDEMPEDRPLEKITREQALRTLEHLRDTAIAGNPVVNWWI